MSKKQDCIAMSSAEAEYLALSASCAQVMWMRTHLKDYGFNYNKIMLYCDSQSAIAILCNLMQHSRTKHIHTRYHFIKEQVKCGIIELYFVRTEYQLADMFTKILPQYRFEYLTQAELPEGNLVSDCSLSDLEMLKCMTRSSTKELFTPFKDPKREFRSSRKHFKTLSLDESRSPDFDLFFDQEEYSEEMELRTNTFSGLDHEDANEHIEKVLEIVDLFHILNITIDQVMTSLSKILLPARTEKRVRRINNFQQEPDENLYQAWEQFKELLMKYPQHYLTEMQEVVLFYNGLDVPTRQILDSRGAIPSKTVLLCLLRPRSTKTSDELAAIQAQLNNLRREIKKVNEKVYAAQVGCEQCKGPHYTKDCPLKEEGKTFKEAYYT
ncbi:reverse transcriptase domain-containing protein [Tanacetum coccineum]